VVPFPSVLQLADIALDTAKNTETFLETPARVAFPRFLDEGQCRASVARSNP
jgi:phosphotransacetylase